MMVDSFSSASDSLIAPARLAFSLSPDDDADIPLFTKAIYVGNGGNITLRSVDSESDVVFTNVQDGTILDVRCRAVRASGTTATNIVGLA